MYLPIEIVNHILDYHYSLKHFGYMKQIKNDIIPHRNKLIKDMCIQHLNDIWYIYNYDWIWRFEDVEYYIQIFSNCTCCIRHQNKRPTLQQLYDGFIPEYSTSPISVCDINDCNCACRHLSRHLCREVNDIIMD